MIRLEKDRCKNCEICIEFCPKKVFDADVDGSPIVAREEDCSYCRLCEKRCPDFVIKVEGEK